MFRKLLILALACPALFAASAAPVPTPVSFSGPQLISTNFHFLTGVAVADFNGDGKPDIAVTDDSKQNVFVYLNNGTGHFGTPVVTTLAIPDFGGFGALVAGDVNEDGKIDLVVDPLGTGTDAVLLGKGDGTFTLGNFIPGADGFVHAALVDLNGDGHLDFVSGRNGAVAGALGDGKGNFSQLLLSIPGESSDAFPDLTVGDFNGDKLPDLITVGYFSNSLIFLAGSLGGQFAPAVKSYPTFFSPYSITSADFNGDGKLDLVVGTADVALLFYGNGDGTFQIGTTQEVTLPLAYVPVTSLGTTPPRVASADMNGDGKTDIVAADNTYNRLSVLLNDGSGKFSQRLPDYQATLDPALSELRLSDLNGDGLPDIVITNSTTQEIYIYLSVASKFASTVSVQTSAQQALSGSTVTLTVKINGSAAHIPTGTVSLSSGTTSFGQQPVDATGQATFALANLAAGQYSLIASYSGDNYNSAASNLSPITQSITDFQATLPSPTQSVSAGANATYSVSIAPLDGFSGTISLGCSGLPAGYSCEPASSVVSGQTSVVPLVVSAPASTARLARENTPRLGIPVWLAVISFAGLGISFRRRIRLLALSVFVSCLGASLMIGCGSSSSKPSAYIGTSTFTISATASQGAVILTHQVTATLTVQ